MLQKWEFSEVPDEITIRDHGTMAEITFAENVEERHDAQGNAAWYADVFFLTVKNTGNLMGRITRNKNAFLEKAKRETRRTSTQQITLGADEMAEMLLDQEVRISILEMGVVL